MITSFLPKPNEIIEQSIMFNESLRAYGYKCEVLIPSEVNIPQMGYQEERSYDDSDKFDAYISIDSHPRPKLLQSLGWDIEDDETKPMIAYISRYLQPINAPRDVRTEYKEILPKEATKLVLDYSYEDQGREFIVTRVSSDQFNPVYYIIKIVPYRPIIPHNPDPLQDNNVDQLNVQEFDNQFRFLNKDRSKQVSIKY